MEEKANILVVDDEEIVRLSHTRVLREAHCNVRSAWNGDEALREMEKHPYDLVLLDLRMPGKDGLETLKAIKERWPASAVLIVTGYPSAETAKQAIRLGAYDYLAKPVPPDEVIKAASAAVTQKKWTLQREPTAAN